MDSKIIDYIPKYIGEFREIKALMESQQPEVDKLWQEIMKALNNQFVAIADLQGIKEFEALYKIIPRSDATLEERRFAVLTKMNIQPPYTEAFLRRQLAFLCGEDGYSLSVAGYELNIKLELKSRRNVDTVHAMLDRVAPCNMVIRVTIKYNQHSTLANFTHGELAKYSHYDLRNEVIAHGN